MLDESFVWGQGNLDLLDPFSLFLPSDSEAVHGFLLVVAASVDFVDEGTLELGDVVVDLAVVVAGVFGREREAGDSLFSRETGGYVWQTAETFAKDDLRHPSPGWRR